MASPLARGCLASRRRREHGLAEDGRPCRRQGAGRRPSPRSWAPPRSPSCAANPAARFWTSGRRQGRSSTAGSRRPIPTSTFREGKEARCAALTGWNRNEGATFPHAAPLAAHKNRRGQVRQGRRSGFCAYPATDDVTARQSSKNVFRDATFAWGTDQRAPASPGTASRPISHFFDHPQPLGAQQTP